MVAADVVAPLHVVGIGASAGGLDPIETFFDNLPGDTGMAFVLVQHLSPDFRSVMGELLVRHTDMPIHLVEDGMPVQGNHVYLIPARKEMVISGGRLLLSDRTPSELALPIDVFFRSLAQDCGRRAIAIVLSGGGSDGSRGVRDVREAGGLVLVQDTDSAQFDGMPKTAREAGVAHWVLAPHEMPGVLLHHRRAPTEATTLPDASRLAAVYEMLQREYGLDFTLYKPTTVTRRIQRRLTLAASPDIEEYVERLRRDRTELDVLYRDLLIGVTTFFRDEPAWTVIEERVLPELFARKADGTPLRIWVAGCATGEEAYSFGIALLELMSRVGERPVKVFATDVHRESLDRATRGLYDASAVSRVSADRLERYFVRVGDKFQVGSELRSLVVFAAHDVIKDAPFTRVDLISCRNLLIYLTPAAQHKVLGLFDFALHKQGVLFLGPSESPGTLAGDFDGIDKHWKIYRKLAETRIRVEVPRPRVVYPDPRTATPATGNGGRASMPQLLSTYDAVLDEVMPPSLLVNEQGDLVHVFGGASRFLKSRDGRQGSGVLESVDGELHMVLSGGLKRAFVEAQPVVFRGVRIDTNGKAGAYTVTLRRIPGRNLAGPHALIHVDPMALPPVASSPRPDEIDLDQVSREQLARLEAELRRTKESLQAAVEELQSTNEEFQASNEELQASNEELQSTNEELQSVNEELYTVNAEYQRKIAELTELTYDMDNLLSSTAVGTIFLDKDLVIRKFTPQIAETFSLMPQDVGRSIETFASRLDHPELVDDMRRVVAIGDPVERELKDRRGKAFFIRLLPYRARGKSDGVVLTVIDVSSLKAAEDALFHERYLLNSLLHNVPDGVYFKDARGRFIRVNPVMAARLGVGDVKAAEGRRAEEMPNPVALALDQTDDEVLRTGQPKLYQLEKREQPDGSEAWDLTTCLPLRDAQGAVVGVVTISRNVSEQKRAEERANEAVRRRDQFLAMLSHELRNPLGAVVNATSVLRRLEGVASGPAAHALAVMDRQSNQMARLLDDLLEVSRVTQNKIELRRERIDLCQLAAETAENFKDAFASVGATFSVNMRDEPVLVDADPARIQQVIVNLLGNAVKYAPGGDVALTVGEEEGSALIRVHDTGSGIPRSMLDSVFDLFVQASATIDRSAGGLGVGLTLVRSLASMHGGSVSVASEGEGKGAQFTVRLPLAEGSLDTWTTRTNVAHPPRPRSAEKPRVVVVEDNIDSREMLCELLGLAGYECHTAANGGEALALIARVKPTVALVDIGLPGMDGYEVARRIREDPMHAGLRLIALTGYGQRNDRAASRAAGFDEHLVKPVAMADILGRLSEMHDPDGTGRVPSVTWTGQPRGSA